MSTKSEAEEEAADTGCLYIVCITILALSVGHLHAPVYGWITWAVGMLLGLVAEKRGWI